MSRTQQSHLASGTAGANRSNSSEGMPVLFADRVARSRKDQILSILEKGTKAVMDSRKFKDFLDFCSHFHRYSFLNRILIHIQKPGARYVAGMREWNKLGRRVKKGEKGIVVFAPAYSRVFLPLDDGEEKGSGQTGVPRELLALAHYARKCGTPQKFEYQIKKKLRAAEMEPVVKMSSESAGVDIQKIRVMRVVTLSGQEKEIGEKDAEREIEKILEMREAAKEQGRELGFRERDIQLANTAVLAWCRYGWTPEDFWKFVKGLKTKKNVYFIPVRVFDVSQTEGKPLPSEICQTLEGKAVTKDGTDLYGLFKAFVERDGIEISEVDRTFNGAKGYTDGKTIVIQKAPSLQMLKTLVHEYGHIKAGHLDNNLKMDRAAEELQAETTAYLVCRYLGLDTSQYSFEYLAFWQSASRRKTSDFRKIVGPAVRLADRIYGDFDNFRRARTAVDRIASCEKDVAVDLTQTPAIDYLSPRPQGTCL